MTCIVGIDPGKAGALVVLTPLAYGRPPLIEVHETAREFLLPGKKRGYAVAAMASIVRTLDQGITESRRGEVHLAVVETPSPPHPGAGGRIGRQVLGIGYGLWLGILAAYRVPTLEISPGVWMNRMLKGRPGTGKERAIGVAMGWLPHLELPKARARAETIAEAACLAILGAQELALIERSGWKPSPSTRETKDSSKGPVEALEAKRQAAGQEVQRKVQRVGKYE